MAGTRLSGDGEHQLGPLPGNTGADVPLMYRVRMENVRRTFSRLRSSVGADILFYPQVSVLGDDVNIKDELLINGASVLPHKSIRCAAFPF